MRKHLALWAGVLLVTGCYRITVLHGTQPPPSNSTVIDYPWQHGWVFGLVPPPEINVGGRCPAGVSKVETRVSFLNGLASALVGVAVDGLVRSSNDSLFIGAGAAGLWQPMSAKITCAPR